MWWFGEFVQIRLGKRYVDGGTTVVEEEDIKEGRKKMRVKCTVACWGWDGMGKENKKMGKKKRREGGEKKEEGVTSLYRLLCALCLVHPVGVSNGNE